MDWHQDDLTAAASASLPVVNQSMSAYAFEDQGTQHVVYLGQDLHVEELDNIRSFLLARSMETSRCAIPLLTRAR
jgi:hypothetical protein